MAAEVVPAPDDADGELGVHRTLRDPEPLGDVPVRETFDATQEEYLATPSGQALHRVGEQGKFLVVADGFGGIGLIIYNGQRLQTV